MLRVGAVLNPLSSLFNTHQDLSSALRQHLDLNYTSEHTSDAKVLAIYPSALTRRVLIHNYLEPISK
jgi:hypothetical protein